MDKNASYRRWTGTFAVAGAVILGGLLPGLLPGTAQAAPVTLTGNYLQVGISDRGTFGSNGSTPPGIRHDPTGLQNFCPGGICNDYLTPGTPHDGFSIVTGQSGVMTNSNNGASSFGTGSPTLLAGAAALGYDNAASWTGSNALLSVTNSYFFNDGDEIIRIITTITALQELTDVAFGRSNDPDPDVNLHGSFATVNTRGDSTTAPENLVSSAGAVSGLVLGILNLPGDPYLSNTGISSFCCSPDNPYNVLAGYGPTAPGSITGDYGLQMAWDIGDLATGQSATINYAFVFGDNQETVGTVVSAPAPLALFGLGVAALAFARRFQGRSHDRSHDRSA